MDWSSPTPKATPARSAAFPPPGGTSLDLEDVGFVSPAQASFSGDAGSGVLTVTDGTHTAKITLSGDYLDTDFTSASDGQGGTLITGSAADDWLNTAGGDFAASASWSAGEAPGADSDAILDAPASTSYEVDATQSETVRSLQLGPQAQLLISAPFAALDGTGSGVIAGTVWVENGATLTLDGTVDIKNIVYDNGGASETTILIGAGGVSLTGGFSFFATDASAGSLVLSFYGGKQQQIIGATASTVLTNVDDRISGQGALGAGRLVIDNQAQGFIEAKGGLLVIDTGAATIVNAGLIDAEGEPSFSGAPRSGLVREPRRQYRPSEGQRDRREPDVRRRRHWLGRLGSHRGRGPAIQCGLRPECQLRRPQRRARPRPVAGLRPPDRGFLHGRKQLHRPARHRLCQRRRGDLQRNQPGAACSPSPTGRTRPQITSSGDYLGSTFMAASDGHGGTIVTDRTTSSRVSAHAFAAAAAALVATAAHARPAPLDSGEDRRGLLALPGTHGTEPSRSSIVVAKTVNRRGPRIALA